MAEILTKVHLYECDRLTFFRCTQSLRLYQVWGRDGGMMEVSDRHGKFWAWPVRSIVFKVIREDKSNESIHDTTRLTGELTGTS